MSRVANCPDKVYCEGYDKWSFDSEIRGNPQPYSYKQKEERHVALASNSQFYCKLCS
jgi:hypothetical protein